MGRVEMAIYYHLPGLFEFYDFYREFLPLYHSHREYFYEWCEIGSIYGAPYDCIWGGGRVGFGEDDAKKVWKLLREYEIPARLTFSNSLLKEEHLGDRKCNDLLSLFHDEKNGVIIYSKLLLDYIKVKYPKYHFISSTTKVLTDFDTFVAELNDENYKYVVPDFRLNKKFEKLEGLTQTQKDKVEFLCNECCYFGCADRKACYEAVSRKSIGEAVSFECKAPDAKLGYVFSKAMENPGFISVDDIVNRYMKMGFENYKIEGRSLGSALLLEFILYYMIRPECQLKVREALYLDANLDLF